MSVGLSVGLCVEIFSKIKIIKKSKESNLIILMLKKISTDRQTNQQTFGPKEATCRRLKSQQNQKKSKQSKKSEV